VIQRCGEFIWEKVFLWFDGADVMVKRKLFVIPSEAMDLHFSPRRKTVQASRQMEFGELKLPRRGNTDLSCTHNLPRCMRS
jgi:hypothetical protein